MNTPAIPPSSSGNEYNPSNPWAPGEMPPGPPMPINSPWVQAMCKMFPSVDPGILSQYAARMMSNMMQMLGTAISHMTQKSHEAAQHMKDVIEGKE